MTNEEQRIAIAEACDHKDINGRTHILVNDEILWHIPDYLNDLNAMCEALRYLDDDQWFEFMLNLQDVLKRDPNRGKWTVCRENMQSSAAQRAEAFLKTLNLWTP